MAAPADSKINLSPMRKQNHSIYSQNRLINHQASKSLQISTTEVTPYKQDLDRIINKQVHQAPKASAVEGAYSARILGQVDSAKAYHRNSKSFRQLDQSRSSEKDYDRRNLVSSNSPVKQEMMLYFEEDESMPFSVVDEKQQSQSIDITLIETMSKSLIIKLNSFFRTI